MKVLLANKFFFANGGSEAVMFHERDFLRAAGVEVIEFSMADRRNVASEYAESFVDNQAYRDGTAGVRAALKLIHSSEAVRKIGALIDRTQPDLVHCHNIYHQLTPSIIGAAKRRGVPTVLTLHDYKPVCPTYVRLRDGHVCSDCIEHGFSKVIVNRCADGSLGKSALLYAEAVVQRALGNYEKLDAIVAPSEFMRTSVAHRFKADRVTVIPNGVDTRSISASDVDGNYALYIGRLSAEKGVDVLLEAHATIADRVSLMVAGTGPIEPVLREQFPRAQFRGHLSGQALIDAIAHASVIVVPSNWYENCPMSVLEAMAYRKPVIGSDMGGIPELVAHGESGLLFPAGDRAALQRCLLELMGNPERRHVLGAAGRTRVEQSFSLERHNAALMRLYERVIEASKRVAMRGEPVRNEI